VNTRPLSRLVRRPGGVFGLVVVALLLIAAAVSLVWTPHPLLDTDVANSYQGPSAAHWLGTDAIGRDTASWLMAGARTTVVVAVLSTVIAGIVGIGLALAGSLAPRWVREPLVVVVDVLIAFPTLPIAMLLASTFGGSLGVVVVAVGVGFGFAIARVVRPEIARVHRADFVLASRAAGVRPFRAVVSHVLPNAGPLLFVQLSLAAAFSILSEAGLSYLGYGAPSGTPSWGRLLNDSQQYITVVPSAVVWPGLTITVTILGITLLGDALREAFDPRLFRRALTAAASVAEPPAIEDARLGHPAAPPVTAAAAPVTRQGASR